MRTICTRACHPVPLKMAETQVFALTVHMSIRSESAPDEIGTPLKQAFVKEIDEESDAAHPAQI